ncbi:PhoX family phosphatase [Kineococcus endophyticus]|uniref:PhoX family phosphatase n=2 Tax=Kineococcus endophyticus TaxID=1181883 RepID=A0ABV3P8L0_9ACTN
MTTDACQPTLTLLPYAPAGRRSPMTCHYRCATSCATPVQNRSANAYFGDVVRSAVSRRGVLAGLVGLGVAGAAVAGARPAAASPGGGDVNLLADPFDPGHAVEFEVIAPVPAEVDSFAVPAGWTWAPLISWGDPILPGAPEFDHENQSEAAQLGQFGYNNDYTTIVPLQDPNRALLVCNNEYTNEELMFRDWVDSDSATEEQLRISIAAHGMSVVELRRAGADQPWGHLRESVFNRRITPWTPMAFTGPAAGAKALRTSADPQGRTPVGTFGNCAGGTTPWGTVLSGEENFNGYFSSPETEGGQSDRYSVYGSSGRGWERVDPRFGAGTEPNEAHRFGWIVEVDPSDPTSTPRKHTAMGRMKHEGATVSLAADGRAVAYMGDDERFEYLYKFVSKETYREGDREHNLRLLEDGDLFVAVFEGDGIDDERYDGRGRWVALTRNGRSVVPGMSVEEVLVNTRAAADVVGATKMDRPEDVERNPVNGRVYVACTNNTQRGTLGKTGVDEANPRPLNKDGHVVEIVEARDDAAATEFAWNLVLVCGDPEDQSTYFGGFDPALVSPISCPDNVAFDTTGNLWISTDGNTLGSNDGLFEVVVDGPDRGRVRQFLSVPTGAETCGPVIADDGRTVFVAVQHPGEVDGATIDEPASTFPYDGTGQPRPSVVQVRKD